MNTSKILPATFLAVAVTLSGLTVATAQTSDVAPAQAGSELAPTKADFRGGRGDHKGRRGGGAMMFGEMMQDIDADGDEAITQDEINAFYTAKVAEADASGDGALTLEEFQVIFAEMTRGRMVDAFQHLDADGDGSVTGEELDDRFGRVVERMDRNDDGKLDAEDRGRRGDRGDRGGRGNRSDRG